MRTLLAVVMLFAQPVPVEQEPRHATRFLDGTMRVLEVNIPAGDTSLEHVHRHDIATVCLECAVTRTRPAGGEWSDIRTRAIGSAQITEYKTRPGAHTVRNVNPALSYHLIAVENLRGAGFSVREHELEASAAIPGHTHAKPTVLVKTRGGTWEIVKPGIVHGFVNGDAPQTIVEIELR